MLGFSPWNPKNSPLLLILMGDKDLLMIAATRGASPSPNGGNFDSLESPSVLKKMEESLRLVDSLSHIFFAAHVGNPSFFKGVNFMNQPESYGKWLGNPYNNPVSMCSSESRIILNSFQAVFESFADASFVCPGLCLLLRYASAIWSFLPLHSLQSSARSEGLHWPLAGAFLRSLALQLPGLRSGA